MNYSSVATGFGIAIPYFRQQVNYQKEVSCSRILRWLSAKTDKNAKFLDLFNPPKEAIVYSWLVPTNRELKMPFFLTLRSVQPLSNPKVVDRIKMKLFEATTITRKIILEGGLVVDDVASGSGVAVGTNDALLTVLKQQAIMIMIILVDVTIEDTAEEHNITVDNPSTAFKEEKKVEPVSLGERKNYPFEEFNISNEASKKLTKLINDYLEWIADGMLKHHAGRYCQQQSKVFQNEECLINIIKGFNIPAGLPWHLVDEVYIPINCGDEFHWVLTVVFLKERRIRVFDSMSRRRRSGPSF
ncbi:hypothetical protein T459_09180 [Capsicum annuum]|uniref:Ubiquitin-like protease family profile domain-containing protein n=1 Tax=Capsicum annuum TaxID=4072 RepID=A0A2G2ZYM6_CAPAN|nr:hypothetical protein T459_09180 [Capsicum annuum]